jgi:tungstate transport system permease protein
LNTLSLAFSEAIAMVVTLDPKLGEIVLLSLRVSVSSVALAGVFALPLGAAVAVAEFPGKRGVVTTLNALLGLPAVVVGLAIYLLLSRSGPLGAFGILFTPSAMVIAQAVLVFPLLAALTRQVVADAWGESREQLARWAPAPGPRRSRCSSTSATRSSRSSSPASGARSPRSVR